MTGTGNNVGRRRKRSHNRFRRFVFVTLLTVAVSVQIVFVGRYTISVILDVRWSTVNLVTRSYSVLTRLNLTDDNAAATSAFRQVGARACFVEGLDERNGTPATVGGCPCKRDWFGAACSLPGFVRRSPTPWSKDSLQVRRRPRRVINAFPFNIEFDMLELRFAELAPVVDVFLVLESNYTAYGTPKPLRLLDRLRNGTYPEVLAKLVYVFLDYFPPDAYKDGWVADALARNYLGTDGLRRRLGGLRSDDLVVLNDADELPRRELVSFLKWHDGYSEPVAITYRWSVFGFFWGVPTRSGVIQTQSTTAVSTIAMVVYVFRYQLYEIRRASQFLSQPHHLFDVKVLVEAFYVGVFFSIFGSICHHRCLVSSREFRHPMTPLEHRQPPPRQA